MTIRSLSEPAFTRLTHGSQQGVLSNSGATLVEFLRSACQRFTWAHALFTQFLLLPISILNSLSRFGIYPNEIAVRGILIQLAKTL